MEWYGSYLGAWLGAGGESPPGVISATIHGTSSLTGTLEAVEGSAPAGGHGFVITDHAPRLWWQRKPKAMPVEEAEQKVARIAGTIERIASKQGAASPATRKEIVKAIAPQLAEMPGFDWTVIYQTVLLGLHIRQQEQEAEFARLEAEQAALMRIAQDEDDLLILLLAA
jgi:ATPase subunit of ABC transporter with duplicated ATPase domains